LGRLKLLPAPGAEDDVRRAPRHFQRIAHDAISRERLTCELRKTVFATGQRDELRYPPDSGDLRLVPFFEIDARPAGQRCSALTHLLEPGRQLRDQLVRFRLTPDHSAKRADHAENVLDASVVEHVHFDAGTHKLGRDVGLKVGKPEHEIGRKGDDPVDFRAGECGDLGLLLAGARRAHGEAGDPDNAPVLPQQIQSLRRLLRQADDPLRESRRSKMSHARCPFISWPQFVAGSQVG